MRIPKSWVPILAQRIVSNLTSRQMVEPRVAADKLVEETSALLTEELTVEDRINDEVRLILRKYESEIEKGRLDYKKLFDMTKQKLIRERNIIL